MNDAEVHARTARNRLAIADILEELSPAQWEEATLCEGWTVRHLTAHLLQPMLLGFGRFFVAAIRHRGDTAATVDHLARSIARREPAELIALLRHHAPDRSTPRRVGPMGPFAETCIHLSDFARPLGLDVAAPREDWLELLDYLTSGHAAPGLVPSGRVDGISLRATDAEWRRGDGPELSGTLEALAMAVTGRASALGDLQGPGVEVLSTRLR